MAYGSILEVLFAIKYGIALEQDIDFQVIEPLLIKKMFTQKSQASKDLMKEFLEAKVRTKEINLGDIDPQTLSEHEIDAIAIGFVYNVLKQQQGETT